MAEQDGRSTGEEAWLSFDFREKSQSNECRMQNWVAAKRLSREGKVHKVIGGLIWSGRVLQFRRLADLQTCCRNKCRY